MRSLFHYMIPGLCALLACMAGARRAGAGEGVFSIAYEHGTVVRSFPERSQPVVGIALSGGGARGLAHIGVLQVLEENGIRISNVAGTSMGSIVGGLYAAGYSPHALEEVVTTINWSDALRSEPRRRDIYVGEKQKIQWPLIELRFDGFRAKIPTSYATGQTALTLLEWLTLEPTYRSDGDFNRLARPFRSVCTDLVSGDKVVIDDGNLARAILASSTVPLLLAPVENANQLLVDGGLKDNLPVGEARAMGSDFVIGVVVEESMHPASDLTNPLMFADQATSILMRNITRLSLGEADFAVAPNMDGFSSSDFSDIPSLIEQGRKAAERSIPALRDSLNAHRAQGDSLTVEELIVWPETETEFCRRMAGEHISPGGRVAHTAVIATVEALWESGRYSAVEAEHNPGTGRLVVRLVPAPETVSLHIRGTNTLGPFYEQVTLSAENRGDFTMQAAVAGIDSVIRSRRAAGFSFAHIVSTTYDRTRREMWVEVKVPRLTGIFFDDHLTSRRSMLMRELEIGVGETFDLNKVMETVNNLYGTNLYELVYLDVEQYRGGVGLHINIREKDWSVVRLGLRYDQYTGSEGRVTMTRENILGFGNQLSLLGQSGNRQNLFVIENKNDRIYRSYYTFSVRFYRHFRTRPVYLDGELASEYEDESWGTILSFGQQMEQLGNAMLQLKSETLRTHFKGAGNVRKRELRSMVVKTFIDSYDRYPFPESGSVNFVYIENASEVLGGSEQFTKIFWESNYVTTPLDRHSFLGSFYLGTADPSIPDIEAFRLGGMPARRGLYDSDGAGSLLYAPFPGLADEELRGTRMAVIGGGYQLFVPRMFYLELLYHTGNVWNTGEHITMDTIRHSFGARASFLTPAGPLSFGWGTTDDHDEFLYLSAGWEF